MPDGLSIEFPQMRAWMAELAALPEAVRQRVAKGAVATAASVLRQEIKRRAPVYTGDVADGHPPPGTLQRSIYQARVPRECTATQEVWVVGVRSGKGAKHDAYYARWVEYGHYARTPAGSQGGAAAGTKFVAARPFFRPGLDTAAGAAANAMQQYLATHMDLATATLRYIKAIA